MDIFAKCYVKSTADQARERGLYPYFRALESRQDVEVMMEGKRRIMLGSNNYLGLTTNPEIIESKTPIIPIYTYDMIRTLQVQKEIYENGVYVNAVLPPACAPGECLLRTSFMATLTESLIDEAAGIMSEVLHRA